MNLNVGCGGNELCDFTNSFDDCISVDIRVPFKRANDFVRCSGEALPFVDRAFKEVYSIDVIEHVDNPTRFIKELGRVCSYKFVIGTPNALFGLNFFYALIHDGSNSVFHDHIVVFGKAELENLFSRCGYKRFFVEIDTYRDDPRSILGSLIIRLLPRHLRMKLVGVVYV